MSNADQVGLDESNVSYWLAKYTPPTRKVTPQQIVKVRYYLEKIFPGQVTQLCDEQAIFLVDELPQRGLSTRGAALLRRDNNNDAMEEVGPDDDAANGNARRDGGGVGAANVYPPSSLQRRAPTLQHQQQSFQEHFGDNVHVAQEQYENRVESYFVKSLDYLVRTFTQMPDSMIRRAHGAAGAAEDGDGNTLRYLSQNVKWAQHIFFQDVKLPSGNPSWLARDHRQRANANESDANDDVDEEELDGDLSLMNRRLTIVEPALSWDTSFVREVETRYIKLLGKLYMFLGNAIKHDFLLPMEASIGPLRKQKAPPKKRGANAAPPAEIQFPDIETRTYQFRGIMTLIMQARDILLNAANMGALINSQGRQYVLPLGSKSILPQSLILPNLEERFSYETIALTNCTIFALKNNLRRMNDGTIMREYHFHGIPTNFWVPWRTPHTQDEDKPQYPIPVGGDGAPLVSNYYGGGGGDDDVHDMVPCIEDSSVKKFIHHIGLPPELVMKVHSTTLIDMLQSNPLHGQFPYLQVSRSSIGTVDGVYRAARHEFIPHCDVQSDEPACSVFIPQRFNKEWLKSTPIAPITTTAAAGKAPSKVSKKTKSGRAAATATATAASVTTASTTTTASTASLPPPSLPYPGPDYCKPLKDRNISDKIDQKFWRDNAWIHSAFSIPTPHFDSLLTAQNLSWTDIVVMFLLIGRMRYKTHKFDKWDIALFILGVAGTGKSTIAEIIEKMWAPGGIGYLEQNVKDFDIYPAISKYITVAREFKGVGALPVTTFLKMTTGEPMQLAVKNKDPIFAAIAPPLLLLGNIYEGKSDGGNIERRLAIMAFNRVISATAVNGDLKSLILNNELLAIVVKANKIYLAFMKQYPNKDFWALGYWIKPIEDERRTLQIGANSVLAFINDGYYVKPAPTLSQEELGMGLTGEELQLGRYIEETKFKQLFKMWCDENKVSSNARSISKQNIISAVSSIGGTFGCVKVGDPAVHRSVILNVIEAPRGDPAPPPAHNNNNNNNGAPLSNNNADDPHMRPHRTARS